MVSLSQFLLKVCNSNQTESLIKQTFTVSYTPVIFVEPYDKNLTKTFRTTNLFCDCTMVIMHINISDGKVDGGKLPLAHLSTTHGGGFTLSL